MSKKKDDKKDDGKKSKSLEFKPGNKPYYEYDGVVLNANVPWNELIVELVEARVSVVKIATYAQCSIATIIQLTKYNFENLSFRSGARIVTLHSIHRPEFYGA